MGEDYLNHFAFGVVADSLHLDYIHCWGGFGGEIIHVQRP